MNLLGKTRIATAAGIVAVTAGVALGSDQIVFSNTQCSEVGNGWFRCSAVASLAQGTCMARGQSSVHLYDANGEELDYFFSDQINLEAGQSSQLSGKWSTTEYIWNQTEQIVFAVSAPPLEDDRFEITDFQLSAPLAASDPDHYTFNWSATTMALAKSASAILTIRMYDDKCGILLKQDLEIRGNQDEEAFFEGTFNLSKNKWGNTSSIVVDVIEGSFEPVVDDATYQKEIAKEKEEKASQYRSASECVNKLMHDPGRFLGRKKKISRLEDKYFDLQLKLSTMAVPSVVIDGSMVSSESSSSSSKSTRKKLNKIKDDIKRQQSLLREEIEDTCRQEMEVK